MRELAPIEPAAVADDALRATLIETLGHQYDIGRLLGRGGMGAVYLARDRVLERAVAIKVLPPEGFATMEARERFRREARTVASLTHPNIVPMHAFGEAAGLGYYVMGYVRGEYLADRMQREGQLDPDDARRMLAELADALDYAHRSGVVHRDIKPDNILLDDATGRPLLTDFGIAKAQAGGETLTQLGMVMGTPHYMSPEQASGEPGIDGRSDLYSLGVVAYAMLAGRPPFIGGSLQEVLIQHLTATPLPLHEVTPVVPDDLSDIVMRCLVKDPAQRWPDGRALRHALGADFTTDASLPLQLRVLIGHGLIVVLSVAASLNLLLFALTDHFRLGIFPGWFAFYPMLFTISVLLTVQRARREGFAWRQILRVAGWQPRWWILWWPARLSRPGDVTPRIPRPIRLTRGAFSLAILLVLVALGSAPFIDLLIDSPRQHTPPPFAGGTFDWLGGWSRRTAALTVMLPSIGSCVLMAAALVGSVVYGRRRGLSTYDASRLTAVSGLSPFWEQRHVFPILLTPAGRSERANPGTPHEIARGIATLADALTGPIRALGPDAMMTARALLGELEALDRELRRLAESAETGERLRLEQRLATLDPGGALTTEQREMRALLAGQLALLDRIDRRRTIAEARQQELAGMLRHLWQELVELERASRTGVGTPDAARVRALALEYRDAAEPVAAVPAPARIPDITPRGGVR